MENTNNNKGALVVKDILNIPTKDTVRKIKDGIEQGDINPAYMGVVLKKFSKIAETVKKDKKLQSIIEENTKTYQEGNAKTFNCFGAKVTIANRGFWDYSNTQDPLLEKLEAIEQIIKERIKLRKTEIETATAIWNSENSPHNIQQFGIKAFNLTWNSLPVLTWEEGYGEIETNPPSKRSTEQLRYTL